MTKRTPNRLNAEYSADKKNVFDNYGAAQNPDGKYFACILLEGEPDGGMAYLFDSDYKKRRIHTSTFYRLLDEDKAVRVSGNAFKK